jgi:alkylation response protein AidB-like acyl-CoA dehydrogenase
MSDSLGHGDDIRRALSDSAARLLASGDDDAGRFGAMAEAGWLAIAVPEASGGLGLGLRDLAAIARAVGEAGSRVPVLAMAGVSLPLLAAAPADATARRLLDSALAGETKPVLAHAEPASGHRRDHVGTTLAQAAGGLRLHGRKAAIEGAALADHLLVTARQPDGSLALAAVPLDQAGVEARRFTALDGRLLMDVSLDTVVPQEHRIALPDPGAALDSALDRGALLAMAEAVGSMRVLLADTLAYLKTRRQFGQPIGRFQVLQHRAVDLTIALEEAEAVVDAACDAEGSAEFSRAVAVAKVVACRSARLVAREAVQMHGGIGITEELRVSHHFRSLTAAESRYGDDDAYRARFAALTASDPSTDKEHRA